MPELHEVESAKRSLQRVIRGKVVASVEVRSPSAVVTHRLRALPVGRAGSRSSWTPQAGWAAGGWRSMVEPDSAACAAMARSKKRAWVGGRRSIARNVSDKLNGVYHVYHVFRVYQVSNNFTGAIMELGRRGRPGRPGRLA